MAIIFPPWVQASNPVPAYLQALSQGAALAGEQNQSDRAALQFSAQAAAQERAAMAEAERANQFAQEMAFNREREARLARQAGLEMRATEMTLAQRAAQQARELAAQRKIEAGIQAGLNPAEAIRRAAYLLPINAIGQIAQMDSARQNREKAVEDRKELIQYQNAAIVGRAGFDTVFNADGSINPEQLKLAQRRNAELRDPYKAKTTKAFMDLVKKANPNLPKEDLDQIEMNYYASGPAALNPQTKELTQIISADNTARGFESTLGKIAQFDAKFGENAFNKFTGPLEGRIQNMRETLTGFNSEDAKLANEIQRDLNAYTQAYRTTQFGLALTGPETKLFDGIVARMDQSSYRETMDSFRRVLSDAITMRLKNYPIPTIVPPELVKRYRNNPTGVLGSGDATGGLVPRNTADGRVALFDPTTKKFVRYAK